MLIRHFSNLPAARIMLWLFLLWYLAMVVQHFEASPRLWLNALAMSLIIGSALVLSAQHADRPGREFWRLFRLYAIPFCVSSFSALVQGEGFYAIFSPSWRSNLVAVGCCAAFGGWILIARAIARRLYPRRHDRRDDR